MAAFRVCQAAPIITLSGQHLCHLNNGGASSVLDFGHIRLSPQTSVVCEGSPYVSGVLRLLLESKRKRLLFLHDSFLHQFTQ